MRFKFSNRSKTILGRAHPLLQTLFETVIAHPDLPHDITVMCSTRTKKEQNALFDIGTSKLRFPHSKHNLTPSMAVDVAPYVGGLSWDWKHYHALAPIVKRVWDEMDVDTHDLEWGGDWKSFPDGPHWQIVPKKA
tara:strand:+ start:6760 stop:7164 length:405 start_codon:yes stop_codon:yes gene_type:complete